MGNTVTHGASVLGGSSAGAALLTILTVQFHMDPGLAGAWIIFLGGVIAGPLIAWLSVRSKGDPALAAALDAITAISKQQQSNGTTPGQPEVEATVTATATAPATATVVATTPVTPPPPTPNLGAPSSLGAPLAQGATP